MATVDAPFDSPVKTRKRRRDLAVAHDAARAVHDDGVDAHAAVGDDASSGAIGGDGVDDDDDGVDDESDSDSDDDGLDDYALARSAFFKQQREENAPLLSRPHCAQAQFWSACLRRPRLDAAGDAFELVAVVDSRESQTTQLEFMVACEACGLRSEVHKLPVGDFALLAVPKDANAIANVGDAAPSASRWTPTRAYIFEPVVERKTWGDMANAVLTGRHADQRLRQVVTRLCVFYAIEGDIDAATLEPWKREQTLKAANALAKEPATTIGYFSSVRQTCTDIAKTFAYYKTVLESARVCTAKKPKTSLQLFDDVAATLRARALARNKDVEANAIDMMSATKSVTQKRAEAIMQHFSSIANVVRALDKDVNATIARIAELSTENGTRVGPTTARAVARNLLGEEYQE